MRSAVAICGAPSCVVVVADHGEGINQHNWPQHGRTWREQVRVPLLIRFPDVCRVRPGRVDTLTNLQDLLPTVFGRLHLPWAETFLKQTSGIDALAARDESGHALARRSARDCEGTGGPLYALTSEHWRYHLQDDGTGLLFDMVRDPHELNSVALTERATAERLRSQTRALVAIYEKRHAALHTAPQKSLQLDEQTRREMQALGYIGGGGEKEPNDITEPTPSASPSTAPTRP